MITPGQIINQLQPGVFRTLTKVRPVGSLQVRKQASGTTSFYWRYSIGGSSERVPIGLYDSAAPVKSLVPTNRGYSFAAAVRAAEDMAIEHQQHREDGGRRAVITARQEAEKAEAEARRLKEEQTLKKLLGEYCDYLESLGRRSHADARSLFKLHVYAPWGAVAELPARDVTDEQFADMMRRLIKAGKGRTANKLRSYARAAYQLAKSAKTKPSIPLAFKAYGISHNPVAETVPDESQNRADKRPLSADELRTYWGLIKKVPGIRGASLRLHLLTGGQRIEQLVKARTATIASDSLTLLDGKGRPGRPPRSHGVPLTKAAAAALAECGPSGDYALSTDGGRTHIAATTLSTWAQEAAGDEIAGFQAKRIRSGVETLLAAMGVSRETRGRLQSHGISGVQARHYDGHDYHAEKLAALAVLEQALLQPSESPASAWLHETDRARREESNKSR